MTKELQEAFRTKIKVLNETAWEYRVHEPLVDRWLANFCKDGRDIARDKLHALHLLSQFMYFGNRELRALLRSLYRDLFRYPILQRLRLENGDLTDAQRINDLYEAELAKTRFLGMGNPSESGVHLLYYFRQETGLPKAAFINSHEIFTRANTTDSSRDGAVMLALRDPTIRHFVFLDDLCGSGTQAMDYSTELLNEILDLGSNANLHYYVLFATSDGLKAVRESTAFDHCECVFELDGSYRVFDGDRYFSPALSGIEKAYSRQMCQEYGSELFDDGPLGYRDGQLLVAFHHNTPDNTLPIVWSDNVTSRGRRWEAVFRRYWKQYSW